MSDDVAEADGTVTLTAPAQHGALSVSATVDIEDDDLPFVTLTPDSDRVEEAGSVTVTLTRDGDITQPLAIDGKYLWTSTSPSLVSDLTRHPVTFGANAASTSFSVTVPEDDVRYFIRRLNVWLYPDADAPFRTPDPPPEGAEPASGSTFTHFQLIAADNDKGKLTVAPGPSPVSETGEACFRLGVDSMVFHDFSALPVDFELTVTESGDYLAASQARSFRHVVQQRGEEISPTDTNYDICLTLDDDEEDEADGTVTLEVTGATNAHYEPGSAATASVTVEDDDAPVVSVEIARVPLPEGSWPIVFRREGDADAPLTILGDDIEISYWYPANATPPSGGPITEHAVTFALGSSTEDYTFGVLNDDLYLPERHLEVVLKARASAHRVPAAPPAWSVSDLSDSTQTVYRFPFAENDKGRLKITAVDGRVTESESACFKLSLTNGYIADPMTVELSITETGDVLAPGQDTELHVTATETPHTVCVQLDDDDESEVNASVTAQIVSVDHADIRIVADKSRATVLVSDDELPLITLTANSTTAPEAGTVSFTATRTGDTSQALTIDSRHFGAWVEKTGYTPAVSTNSLTFPASQSSVAVALTVPDDNLYYVTSSFVVVLTTGNADTAMSAGGTANFALPAVPPSGATGTRSETKYNFDLVEDDKAYLRVVAIASSQGTIQAITEISESAGELCFQISADAVWDPDVDFRVSFQLSIDQTGDFLLNGPETPGRVLQTRAGATDETIMEHCVTLDDDEVSEYAGEVRASLTLILNPAFVPDPTHGTSTVVITDDEAALANAVDVQLALSSSTAREDQEAQIRVARWNGGNSQAPITQAVTVGVKYRFKGDFHGNATFTTGSVDIEPGQTYGELAVDVPDNDLHVKNFVLEVFTEPGADYVVRTGYAYLPIPIVDNDDLQKLGFYSFDRPTGPISESANIKDFVLRRNYGLDRDLPALPVQLRITEAVLPNWSLYPSGNVLIHQPHGYGAQPADARRYGQHTPYPGSRTIRVVMGEGNEVHLLPIIPQNDALEETASMVTVEILGSKGYEVIDGAGFAEICPGAESTRGCGVENTWIHNDDDYEHWLKLTAVTTSVEEGEDAIFRIDRFAIDVGGSPLYSPPTGPVCTTPNPESAVHVPINRVDYRYVRFDFSNHLGVVDYDYLTTPDGAQGHMAAGRGTFEIRAPTVDDSSAKGDVDVTLTLVPRPNPGERYTRPYYCILSGGEAASVEVRDNDSPEYTVSVNPSTVSENAGETDLTVTVQLNSDAPDDLSVRPLVIAGDQDPVQRSPATADDFVVVEQTPAPEVAIAAGSRSGTAVIKFRPVNDNVAENDENLTVTVSVDEDTVVRPARLTIVDNDEGATVAPTALTIVEGAAAGGTFSIVLASQPASTVTIGFDGDDGTDVTVVPDSHEFTTVNWSVPKVFTVTAGSDDDANDDVVTLDPVASTGGSYRLLDFDEVVVTVTDDDSVSVVVTPVALELDEGTSAQYGVALDSVPSDSVTVDIYGASDSDLSLSSSSLTFDTGNWSQAQTVTVSAGHDDDAENDFSVLTHLASGGGYGGLASDIVVIVVDDDTVSTEVTLSVDTATVSEDAGATTVTVTGTLDEAPFASARTVTVSVSAGTASADDFSAVSDFALTIGAGATWGKATFQLTPADDDVDEEDETVTVGGVAHGLTVTEASLTIGDEDTRGVEVAPTEVAVAEGGDLSYTVVLQSAPTGPVTVTLSVSDSDDVTVSPPALTFTSTTWSTAQTVTVEAAEDDDAETDTATVLHVVAGADYGSETADDVTVTVTENETASTAVTLSVDPAVVSEGAGATTVTVTGTLDHTPLTSAKTVTVSVSAGTGSSGDFGAVSDFSLTIEAGESSGEATFELTPADDDVDEDGETVTVGGSTGGLTVSDATLTIEDDDTRGVDLSSTTSAPAEGGSSTYTVALESQPTGQVTVTPSRTGSTDVTVSPPALTFTATTWSTAQTVTVEAAEDADAVNDTATVSHTVAGADYTSVAADDVTVTVSDNETASTAVTLSAAPSTVSESAGATTVTVTGTLNHAPLESAQTVTVSVSAGTASSSDFGAVSDFTLTIDAGETSGEASFQFTPAADDVDEDGETVTIGGSTEGLTVTDGTLTIEDDDTRGVALSPTTLTPAEGGSSTYTVALESQPTGQVTVTPSRTGSTDVTVSPPALTFTATTWSAAQTVTVEAAEDADAETDTATVSHTVAGADYGSETADDVSVTVTDNETASTAVTLSVAPSSVSESAGATTVTVTGTLDHTPLTSAQTVTVSVSAGTASSSDFGAVSDFTLTIVAGATSGEATFQLTPADDDVDEDGETVTVSGSTEGLTVTDATLTIEDDDSRGVEVSPTSLTPAEGGSSTYTVVLTSRPTGQVTVTPSSTGSTDVTVSPPVLTFSSTTWSTPQTVTVEAAEDADAETDTATVSHTVAGADYGSETADDVSVTVSDNETASTAVTLSAAPSSVSESAGATTVTVTGTLDHTALTSAQTVTVSVSTGTASSSDFGAVSDFTLTIVTGATSGEATFQLTPADDDVDEDGETVTVGGTTEGLTVTDATLTIADDDTRGVQVAPTSLTPAEGGSSTYTVALESQPTGEVTVTPSKTGSEDVTVSPPALTFTSTTWSTAQTVTVEAAEDADAVNDTATVAHTVAGADYASETADDVSVSVSENETASTAVTLSAAPSSVSESAGATTVTVTGTLNQAPLVSAQTVTVSVSAGTASSSDFGAVSDFTLTIGAGETSGEATFQLTPADDDVDEDGETVTIGATTEGLTVTDATLTIADDDTRGVDLSSTTLTPAEGGSSTYTVVLESQPTGQVTVTPSRAGSEDVTVSPPALTFTSTTWSTAQTVTVEAAEDDDAETDTATVSHTVAGADYGSETASDVSVTVSENETASTAVTLTVAPSSVSESAGATTVTVTGTLDHTPLTSAQTVTVSVSAGTASSSDFGAVSDFTLTIVAGESSGEATFQLTPADDGVDEDGETVTVGGTTEDLTVTGGTLTIADDDTRGVDLSPTTLTPAEGGSSTYTVALESQPTGQVTVTPSRTGSTDVTVSPPALTFTATTWSTAQTVTVEAAEDADAETDTATVSHTVAGADYGSETASDVSVTVSENEIASTAVTLSVAPSSVSESGGATVLTVTGTLNQAPLTSAKTVTVSVSAGTASSSDFGAVSDFTLTIGAGATSGEATFQLTPADDDVDEDGETVTVGGSTEDLTVSDATLTIEDDDTRGVQVSPTSLTPAEGGSSTYTVVLQSQPTGQVTVTPSRTGSTDVTVSPPALTFTATTWSTAQTVTVEAAEDADAETDTATVSHTVAGADYGSETADDVSVTVSDNETASTAVTLSVAPSSVSESAGATTVTVTGTLDHTALTSAQTVTVSVSAGTASSSDFGAVSDFTLTIAAGTTSGEATFQLTPADDDVDEDDETVTVGGSTGGLTVSDATLTIEDDDTRGVDLSSTTLAPAEGGSSTYTVVLQSQPTGQVTVTPSKTGSTDVTVSPPALTFTSTTWSTAQTVTVEAAEDADAVNDTATVSHTVAGADYASVPASDVTVTVSDNETASTAVTLSVAPSSVSESGGATTVTVTGTLNHAALTSAKTVTVSVSAGTASSSDFGAVSDFTLTIATGATSGEATFQLTPADDDVDEEDETVTVGGSTDDLTVTGGTLTIADDDTRGVQVSPTSVTAPEGGGSSYTVALESQPTGQVTVTPSRTGSTDVTVSPPALTFSSTTWSTAQTVTVEAAEDDDAETDTATVSHTVAGADYGSETASDVSVTVSENETTSTAVTLSVAPSSVSESAGATTVTVTGTLNHTALTSAKTVTVSVSAGTASASDFGAVSDFALTIAAGETSGEATFQLTPADDDIDEDGEMVTVGGSTQGLTVASATFTIADDDTRGVQVSPTSLTPAEGGSSTYTVVLTSQPTGQVTVTPSSTGSTDVTVSPPALTFSSTTWSTAQTVTVEAAEDADAETDTATVSHTVSGADYTSETAANVLVTVSENENVSTAVTLSVSPSTVSESASATTMTVTGTLNHAPLTSAKTVSVSVSAGTASSSDFGAVSDFTLTIGAGATSGEATFQFTPADDDIDEAGETVTVGGSTQGLTVNSVTLTIDDDDTRGVDLSSTTLAPAEGGSSTYTVALESQPTGPVTVTPSKTGSTDVTVSPPALTFTATTWSTAQTVTVEAAEDADAETDTATVSHTVAGADYSSEMAASVSVTVSENETASTAVTLSVAPSSVSESAGATTVTVTGTLNHAALTSATTVSVSVSAGTASSSDFGAVSDFTLTIATGATSGEATFQFTPAADDVDEEDETVTVGGSTQGLTVTGGTLTIADDDTRGVQVSPTSVTVPEGGSSTYTVVLQSQPTGQVTVTPSRTGSTDVTVSPPALTFTATTWSTAQTVTVEAAEDADAVNDTATVSHTVAGADYASVPASDVTVTVSDNETTSTAVTLSVAPSSVSESAGATTVTVTGTLNHAALESAQTVTVSVSAGTASSSDFGAVSDFTLTIATGATSGEATFQLTPADDDVDEENETVTVGGSTEDLTVTGGTLTIADDDTRGVQVSPTSVTAAEGGGSSYTVALESQPTGQVTVTPSRTGSTDVTVSPPTLTFSSTTWSTAQTVTVEAAVGGNCKGPVRGNRKRHTLEFVGGRWSFHAAGFANSHGATRRCTNGRRGCC